MNKWFIGLALFLLPIFLFGNFTLKIASDSINYLSPNDTIFISTDYDNQKVFKHRVAPGQTLYSLAKFYGFTLDELYYYNPQNAGGKYEVGSQITIPIPNRSIIRYRPKDYSPQSYIPVYYQVKRGETLFHIAHRVFKLPIDTIMYRNNLLTPTLSINQKLKIGWMSIEGIPDSYRQFRGHPQWKKSHEFKKRYILSKKQKKEYQRKGAAVFINNAKGTSDLFVMHRKAPIGSILQITNPMKQRTVYAKVVAKIPYSYDAKIEVVVSPKVGKLLGVRDKKFYAKTKYLK